MQAIRIVVKPHQERISAVEVPRGTGAGAAGGGEFLDFLSATEVGGVCLDFWKGKQKKKPIDKLARPPSSVRNAMRQVGEPLPLNGLWTGEAADGVFEFGAGFGGGAVYEENAFGVVEFVLDCSRQEAVGFEGNL